MPLSYIGPAPVEPDDITRQSDLTAALDAQVHDASDIASGTLADARISASSVTQHEGTLSITASQITDLPDAADTKFTRIHRPAGAYTTSAADFSGVVVAAGDVTLHFATPADILKPINIKNLSGGAVSVLFATGVSGAGATTIDDGAALTAIVETADGGAVTYLLI